MSSNIRVFKKRGLISIETRLQILCVFQNDTRFCTTMVHPLFIGLGIIYLGFTVFILLTLLREHHEYERRYKEANSSHRTVNEDNIHRDTAA